MFLPSISGYLLAAAMLLTAACGKNAASPATPVPDAGDSQVRVVAGTGDVAASWVESVRERIALELPPLLRVFEGKPKQRFFVHVHAGRDDLPVALGANLPPESPAFALLGQHQIHIVWNELRRLGASLPSVVRHELVHELLDQYVAPHGRHLPRWLHEGLAQHLAGDTYLQAREDDLVLRVVARSLGGLGELSERFPADVEGLRLAYAHSYSFVSWLVREYGIRELLAVARDTDGDRTFTTALAIALGRRTAELDEAWRDYILHGSGAPWRVVLDQCFMLLVLVSLPVLVLALQRRLAKESRTARQLVDRERRAAELAAAQAAIAATLPPTPEPPGTDEELRAGDGANDADGRSDAPHEAPGPVSPELPPGDPPPSESRP